MTQTKMFKNPKDGHMYEVVGQRPILKRVGDSEDQRKMMKAIAKAKASRSNRTRLGEVYKATPSEPCNDWQTVNTNTGRCVVKRQHETYVDASGKVKESKKYKPLSKSVVKQRHAAEQEYLSRGLSRQQQIAKAVMAIEEAENFLASDGYGHHIIKDKQIPCDEDQVWVQSRKRCIVDPTKVGKVAPGTRGTKQIGTSSRKAIAAPQEYSMRSPYAFRR